MARKTQHHQTQIKTEILDCLQTFGILSRPQLLQLMGTEQNSSIQAALATMRRSGVIAECGVANQAKLYRVASPTP